MNIHEYQAMELFAKYSIPTVPGELVTSMDGLNAILDGLEDRAYVVKAQVHTGGRGKAGGVRIASDKREVQDCVRQILGMRLVTKQTGPQGKTVRKVRICKCTRIKKEYYLAMTVDNATGQVTLIASEEGGMDIEQIAVAYPEKIIAVHINQTVGLRIWQSQSLARKLGLTAHQIRQFVDIAAALFRMFCDLDCQLVEINPLCVDDEDNLIALDAKINFDDNALFRHADILQLRDLEEEDPKEREAQKYNLNYIQLDGNIGCMVNGAGLAMATMDIIQACGGQPSNFLDVGGGATADRISGAFRILLSDVNVRGIFINIFGGIMKCDVIAEGIVAAARQQAVNVPLVVRLEGTNADLGKRILAESGLSIVPANDMAEGARLVCSLTKREGEAI